MGVRVRVKDEPETLCAKCSFGMRIRTLLGTIYICQALPRTAAIPPVYDCTHYEPFGKTEWDFKKTAWILEIKGKQIMGFKPPEKKGKED